MVLLCVVCRSHNQSAMFLRWNEQSVWVEKKQHHGTWNGCLGPEYVYWMNRDIFMRCKYRTRSTSSALDFQFKFHFFSSRVSGVDVEVNVVYSFFFIGKRERHVDDGEGTVLGPRSFIKLSSIISRSFSAVFFSSSFACFACCVLDSRWAGARDI